MWTVTVEFAHKYEDQDWETYDDTVHIARSFKEEPEAKAYFFESREAADDWLDDEGGVRPGPKAIAFVRKHNFTIFDHEGVVCGGCVNGEPVGFYWIAPLNTLSAERVEDVREGWLKEREEQEG